MSLRERIENNIIVFLLGSSFTAFGAGWGAHIELQHAYGMTLISADHLKLLDDRAKQLEDQVKQSQDEIQRLACIIHEPLGG
jgi:hypothetical protein